MCCSWQEDVSWSMSTLQSQPCWHMPSTTAERCTGQQSRLCIPLDPAHLAVSFMSTNQVATARGGKCTIAYLPQYIDCATQEWCFQVPDHPSRIQYKYEDFAVSRAMGATAVGMTAHPGRPAAATAAPPCRKTVNGLP